jgi:phosphoribosylformylglycinamidine synthase subunit PurS
MAFQATIHIMPRPELLDPQGKATLLGLHNLGFEDISQARIGKQVELTIDVATEAEATEQVEAACKKLLANPVIEQYHFELKELA